MRKKKKKKKKEATGKRDKKTSQNIADRRSELSIENESFAFTRFDGMSQSNISQIEIQQCSFQPNLFNQQKNKHK
jgi:hypothetical protein